MRKRYFLIRVPGNSSVKDTAQSMAMKTGTRLKFYQGEYFILLSNQFDKDRVSDSIQRWFPQASVITVSGTMKKCKRVIEGASE